MRIKEPKYIKCRGHSRLLINDSRLLINGSRRLTYLCKIDSILHRYLICSCVFLCISPCLDFPGVRI